VTAADLRDYLEEHDTEKYTFIESCFETAHVLVNGYVGTAVVPAPVLDRARLEVGAQLYRRQNAPGGATQFAIAGDQGAVRVSQDPMAGVYPMLRPYVGPVIA
jgi:hypothetical protein